MKEIKLTQGYVALVDDEDFERVNAFKWWAVKSNAGKAYETLIVCREINSRNEKGKRVKQRVILSRYIMQIEDPEVLVLLYDGNNLNYQKANLHLAYREHSVRTRRKSTKYADETTTSAYKGVSWNKRAGKWNAYCGVKGKLKHLGTFVNEEDAAIAYDKAAIKYFGAYARLNILKYTPPETGIDDDLG